MYSDIIVGSVKLWIFSLARYVFTAEDGMSCRMAARSPLLNCSCWADESVITGMSTFVKYGFWPQ